MSIKFLNEFLEKKYKKIGEVTRDVIACLDSCKGLSLNIKSQSGLSFELVTRPPRKVREDFRAFTRNVVAIDRVSRVTKGGKRLSFRALIVYGDEMGSVSVGVASALVVYDAIQKAQAVAKKEVVRVPVTSSYSIPHSVIGKFGAAKVLLLPSAPGSGVIAGSSIRVVLELAGIKNILSKRVGSSSLINNARATIHGLTQLKSYSSFVAEPGSVYEKDITISSNI